MELNNLNGAFYTAQLLNPMSAGQIALWHALAYIANKSHWPEWFTTAGITLVQLTGLSHAGVKKARNELKQRGLIDFRPNGTKATCYKLIDISESSQNSGRNGSQNSGRNGSQNSGRNGSALYNNTNNNVVVARARPLLSDSEMDEASEDFSQSRQALLEAMESAGMTITSKTEDSMQAMVSDHGLDAVLSAIAKAADSDKKGGVSVAYVRAILNDRGSGGTQPTVDNPWGLSPEALERKRREEARTLARLRGVLPE